MSRGGISNSSSIGNNNNNNNKKSNHDNDNHYLSKDDLFQSISDATELSLLLQQQRCSNNNNINNHHPKTTITAVELMSWTLHQIDQINPKVNAIILLRPKDELLQQAADADAVCKSPKGWLHGIPIAIKDMANVQGFPTTFGGSPLMIASTSTSSTSSSSDFDAPSEVVVVTKSDRFVQHLLDAGAIVIGKTNTPESGIGSHTYNTVFGTTRNPYNVQLSAGGSSGGAAVAIATRMLFLADGSDMMGSLRNPAGWNNIYSHRPTAGLILDSDGDDDYDDDDDEPLDEDDDDNKNNDKNSILRRQHPLPYPISTPGPMARSPRDLKHMLTTMLGKNEKEVEEEEDVVSINNDSSVIRILWLGDWNGSYPCEDGIVEHCCKTLHQQFEKCKKNVEIVSQQQQQQQNNNNNDDDDDPTLPFDPKLLWKSWTTIRSVVIATTHMANHGSDHNTNDNDNDKDVSSSFIGPNGKSIKPEFIWEIQRGLQISNNELREAVSIAHEWSHVLETKIFTKYHAIAMPTAQVWPFPVEWDYPKTIHHHDSHDTILMDTYHRWMEIVVPVSLAGLPCTTLPTGICETTKLPMGIQLAGRRGSDATLLQMAQWYHECNIFNDGPSLQKPPLVLNQE